MSGARKITVDGQEYRWRHSNNREGDELLSIWVEGNRRAILLVRFVHPASPHPDFLEGFAGPVRRSGFLACGVRVYNLHRPALVASLIRLVAGAHAWEPRGRAPLTLDGFALLREHGSAIAHETCNDRWLELATPAARAPRRG
jgi:hypothetical protein